jgi:predicted house-cleaning noncanonical NTP pyrophosphatase (MazG superfamily)
MKLKEDICQSIKSMNNDELVLIYEQIKWLERLRTTVANPAETIPLEKIHKMTGFFAKQLGKFSY